MAELSVRDLKALEIQPVELSQGISEESVATLPQTVAESVMEALEIEKRASVELSDLMAHSVQPVGHLVTASNPVDTKVKVGIKAGLFNLCDASVDHDVEGTIEAGVDLSQVQGSNFTHDLFTNSWTLQLGPAQVTSCRIDYIRQTGHSRSICRQDWDEYRLLAETVVLPEFRNLKRWQKDCWHRRNRRLNLCWATSCKP